MEGVGHQGPPDSPVEGLPGMGGPSGGRNISISRTVTLTLTLDSFHDPHFFNFVFMFPLCHRSYSHLPRSFLLTSHQEPRLPPEKERKRQLILGV